jgi:hypothetical protein
LRKCEGFAREVLLEGLLSCNRDHVTGRLLDRFDRSKESNGHRIKSRCRGGGNRRSEIGINIEPRGHNRDVHHCNSHRRSCGSGDSNHVGRYR